MTSSGLKRAEPRADNTLGRYIWTGFCLGWRAFSKPRTFTYTGAFAI